MFNAISWSAYLQFLFYVLLIYYVVIIFLYYRKDIQLKLARLQQRRSHDKGSRGNAVILSRNELQEINDNKQDHQTNKHKEDKGVLFNLVHDLLEDLKPVFKNAEDKGFKKEELVFALQRKLVDYKPVYGTSFQVAVDEHIMEQAVMQCDIILEPEDIKSVW